MNSWRNLKEVCLSKVLRLCLYCFSCFLSPQPNFLNKAKSSFWESALNSVTFFKLLGKFCTVWKTSDWTVATPLPFCQFRLQVIWESNSWSVPVNSCDSKMVLRPKEMRWCERAADLLHHSNATCSKSRLLHEDGSHLGTCSFHTMLWHCLFKATALLGTPSHSQVPRILWKWAMVIPGAVTNTKVPGNPLKSTANSY